MNESIKKLKDILTKNDKKYLAWLLLFSIFISIIETLGISVIMPFLSVAINNDLIHSNEYYGYFYQLFNFSEDINFVLSFGVILILFYLFRSIVNLAYAYTLTNFAQSRYHLLAYRLFENYLGMSYSNFVKRNSSELTKSIVTEAANMTSLISSFGFPTIKVMTGIIPSLLRLSTAF